MAISKQISDAEISVAAGVAANTTYTSYIDMHDYDACSFQIEWTAGGAGGTVAVTVEASLQDDGTAAASCTYYDVTNDIYGAASFSADGLMYDSNKRAGCAHFLKLKAVIANKDANTALYIYSKKVRTYR